MSWRWLLDNPQILFVIAGAIAYWLNERRKVKDNREMVEEARRVALALAAHEREMSVIALTGRGGGELGHLLRDTDVHVCVPHERTPRIHEAHQLVLHCLCEGLDLQLLGDEESP